MFRPVWQCPLCGSAPDRHHVLERVIGKLWMPQGAYAPVPVFYGICDVCGLVFHLMALEEAAQDNYYNWQYRATIQQGNDGITERVLNEQAKRMQFLMPEFARELGAPKRALDIGSSTGLLLKGLQEVYGCEILGIEPGDAFRENCGVPCLESVDDLLEEQQHSFDLITVIHTLEHLNDPAGFLAGLHDWITPDGILVVEVPDLYRENALSLSHPVAFTLTTLGQMLEKAGFRLKDMRLYYDYKTERTRPANILAFGRPGEPVEPEYLADINRIRARLRLGQAALAADNERLVAAFKSFTDLQGEGKGGR